MLAIYDGNGTLQCRYVYDAWGNHKVLNADGTENAATEFIGNKNPFRYRSYYWDSEFALYYLKSRYYDPELGRFISADGVSYLNPESVAGLNLYAYCENNPVKELDPDGTFIGVLIGGIALIAGGIGIAISFNNSAQEQIEISFIEDQIATDIILYSQNRNYKPSSIPFEKMTLEDYINKIETSYTRLQIFNTEPGDDIVYSMADKEFIKQHINDTEFRGNIAALEGASTLTFFTKLCERLFKRIVKTAT